LNSHTESGITTALQLNEAYDTNRALLRSIQKILTAQETDGGGLTQTQLLELFVNLFGQLEHGKLNTSGREGEVDAESRDSSFDSGNGDNARNRSEKVRTFTRIDSDSSLEGAVRSGKFPQRELSEEDTRRISKSETDAMENHSNFCDSGGQRSSRIRIESYGDRRVEVLHVSGDICSVH